MRKLTPILAFMFLFKISSGQDSIRHFEFGSTLITINSFNSDYYFAPDRPSVDFMNGVFFRFTKKSFGLRLHASYSNNSATFDSHSATFETPLGIAYGVSGNINNKAVRIGVGGQYSILKHKDWLYTFLDLSYQNTFSAGHYYYDSGSIEKFSRTTNSFDSFLGVGFKIKTIKHLFLSPEFGILTSTKFVNQTSSHCACLKSNNMDVSLNPILQLHLTVAF